MDGKYITQDDLLRLSKEISLVRDLAGVSLREYLNTRIEAVVEATDLAKQSMEHRLASLNELRGAMADQAKTYITKAEFAMFQMRYDADCKNIFDKLLSLELTRANDKGKASQTSTIIAGAIGFAGVLIGIVGIIISLM